jgi:rubrerythrin
MATDNQTKQKIVKDFEIMKGFETSTGKFYRDASSDASVPEQEVRDTFLKIADDEDRHAEVVQKIINMINNTL